ncbi:hypothetical protein SDC9_123650 [bioreactor metagenome]|uniref:Uncharacterized protein n=1 Tax=bioreactor metagenome TaxID=1076179 RepID=A0A645CI75_9ZZZZ
MRHPGTLLNCLYPNRLAAAHAVVAVHTAMQLQHIFAACQLVQTVNVLGDHRFTAALGL